MSLFVEHKAEFLINLQPLFLTIGIGWESYREQRRQFVNKQLNMHMGKEKKYVARIILP